MKAIGIYRVALKSAVTSDVIGFIGVNETAVGRPRSAKLFMALGFAVRNAKAWVDKFPYYAIVEKKVGRIPGRQRWRPMRSHYYSNAKVITVAQLAAKLKIPDKAKALRIAKEIAARNELRLSKKSASSVAEALKAQGIGDRIDFKLSELVDPVSAGLGVPEILEEMAKTFRERNAVYKDNWKMVGRIMEAMFPEGVKITTAEDWDRWHLFILKVVKLSRFAVSGLTHTDSIHDDAIYSTMLEGILKQKGNANE